MIQHTFFSPAVIPAENPATTSTEPSGHWAETGVTLLCGVRSLFKSLDPRYVPEHLHEPGQQVEYPSFGTATLQAGQNNGFFQGVELAARIVSHALLSPEVNTLVGGLVNLSNAVRLINNICDTRESNTPPKPVVAVKVDNKQGNTRDKQRPTEKPARSQPTTTHQAGQARTAMALGVLSGFAHAGAAPTFGSPPPTSKDIADAEALARIGLDPDYPLNGNYTQTANFDARKLTQSIGNATHPFTGQYNGQCHTIDNPKHCFVKKLDNAGSVSNLRFTNAHINSTEKAAAVVACEVNGNGTVSYIYVENADVFTSGDDAYAGIGGGLIDGTVEHTTAVNCKVTTRGKYASAGIGGGVVNNDGSVKHTTAVNSNVTTSGKYANAGIAGGRIDGNVAHTTAVNSLVNGKIKNAGNIASDVPLCNGAAPGECQIINSCHDAFKNQNSAGSVCSVNPGTAPALPGTIPVSDAETLFKIGRNVSYPLNGTYQQMADIDARNLPQSIGNETHPFTGKYDGQCHTIENPKHCFVKKLDAGSVSNIRFANAHINSAQAAAVVACEVNRHGRVSYIHVENANVLTSGYMGIAGIGGGMVYDHGKVEHISVVNSRVNTSGEHAHVGIGGGGWIFSGGKVEHISVVNSTVNTSGEHAHAGIGGAWISSGGKVEHISVVNTTVNTSGEYAYAGIGGGVVFHSGNVEHTMAVNSKVTTSGKYAQAGIGGGIVNGTVEHTTALNSRVNTSGAFAEAGIGGGRVYHNGNVEHTMAVNSKVITSGEYAYAGIGGGVIFGTVEHTSAVNSRVITSGAGSDAGIGGGMVFQNGTVEHTTAVNSRVNTSGAHANAGIGGGKIFGTVKHTMALNSRVNGDLRNGGNITSDSLCHSADTYGLARYWPFRNSYPAACSIKADNTPIFTSGWWSAVGIGVLGAAYLGYQWISGYRVGQQMQAPDTRPLSLSRKG